MSLGRFDYLEIGKRRQAVLRPEIKTVVKTSTRVHYRVKEQIGGPGKALGQFYSPGGLAVDGGGDLYVADTYNHRIQKITPSGDVYGFFSRGKGAGSLLHPQGVAVDAVGCIYV